MKNRIVYSALRTPDGTLLVSTHRHDYVTHKDAVTGETYMLDGGIDYVRSNINKVSGEYITVSLEDGVETFREYVTWGTYGKNGDEPYRRIKLCEMTDAHIEACLDTQRHMHPNIRAAFEQELEYREKIGFKIED